MSKIRFHRISPTRFNNYKRWVWEIYRPDNTIGFTTHGEAYTLLGGWLEARWLLRKNRIQSRWEWKER